MKSILNLLSLITLVCASVIELFAQGNVGIGTTTPNPNAILDVHSTNKGLLLPKLDSTARNQIDSTKGLIVYDSTLKSIWFNNNSQWQKLASLKSVLTSIPGSDVVQSEGLFPGADRQGSISFSIGTKGYVGTGTNGTTHYADFWEYNSLTNIWTQKADFGGGPLRYATAFSIGTKGYVVTGRKAAGLSTELWEYDPATDSWTQKANFPGTARQLAAGFSIGNKGYVSTGANITLGLTHKDLWEYDPEYDTWAQKTDFGGLSRAAASCFVINGKAYLGIGVRNGSGQRDFWRFNPVTNSWDQIANFPGTLRWGAQSFGFDNYGFITGGAPDLDDMWQFSAIGEEWIIKFTSTASNFQGLIYGIGFNIGSTGFFGIGSVSRLFYKFNMGPIENMEWKESNPKYAYGGEWIKSDNLLSLSDDLTVSLTDAQLTILADSINFYNGLLINLTDDNLELMDGNVGIGKINPDEKLVVYNGISTGKYTIDGWTHISDFRLKSSIRPIENSLNKILQLQGVQFKWKSDPDAKMQIGFIAQDVEKIFPEIVSKDQNGYYSLVNQNLTAPLVEAIKEQQAEIEELRSQNQSLEARILAIEQLLTKVEK